MKKVDFCGLVNSYVLSNGAIELIVPTRIGPRILSMAMLDGRNIFHLDDISNDREADQSWRRYGGHWLSHGPEHPTRSYVPDNSPVGIEVTKGLVRLRQTREMGTNITKEIDITLRKMEPKVALTHRLHNHNAWSIPIALYSRTVLPRGGKLWVPFQNPHSDLPMRIRQSATLNDGDISLKRNGVMFDISGASLGSFQIALDVKTGWIGYWNNGALFIIHTHSMDPSSDTVNAIISLCDDSIEICHTTSVCSINCNACLEQREEWVLMPMAETPFGDNGLKASVIDMVQTTLGFS